MNCILDDDQGSLWMSTNHGVSRMGLSDGRFENFSTADGLPGNGLTGWNACHRGAGGELFFAGFAGATAVRPERLVDDGAFVPSIVLTVLRLAGEPVAPGQPPLAGSIADAGILTLSPVRTDLLDTIRAVHGGKKNVHADVAEELAVHTTSETLTGRQTEILALIAEGKSIKLIAFPRSVEETVKGLRQEHPGKLGANDPTHAVTIGIRRGIISLWL